MSKPAPYLRLAEDQPAFIDAYERFASVAHDAGPLSERERRLVKLALAIASNSEGATHSHVRQALDAGVGVDDLRHVALLAATTAGFPTAMRALTWISDVTDPSDGRVSGG
jgi:alkylhydroperoxidase/carboxymuconolactone decarboxylase family protein YurZ